MTQHTILLIQKNADKSSKTFSDHETVALALEEIVKLYEKKLKELNPTVVKITYDVKDLNNYIDHLTDLCALVYSSQQKAYIPHDKEWIKGRLLNLLSRIAS